MKAIIYTSNTGSTAEYAQLLGNELNLPVHSLQQAKNKVLSGSEIIYLGWIMAGGKRMKLYFENMVTTVTTLMIVSLVWFVGYSISNRSNINFWGRRSLFVLAYGLVICCFAAARDGLDKTIQYTIDGSCNPGIFSLVSVPNIVGCVGAAIIMIVNKNTWEQGDKCDG